MPSTNSDMRELLEKNKSLQGTIDFLQAQQNKLGMNFGRHSEKGEAQLLGQGKIPYLTFQPEHSTLKADRSVKDTPHLLIEGDNISTLVALQGTHQGKVDAIYIDPPYNTGSKDFIYNDRFVSSDDSFRHSKWLAFMESRLFLAKNLLKDTGIIVVAIGDQEHHRLRMLMDQTFGEQNFISNVVWQGHGSSLAHSTSGGVDYMLIYARNRDTHFDTFGRWKDTKIGAGDAIHAALGFFAESNGDILAAEDKMRRYWRGVGAKADSGLKLYSKIDHQGRLYQGTSLDANNGRTYNVMHPNGLPVKRPSRGWGYTESNMTKMIEEGLIEFGENENSVPRFKRFLEDNMTQLPAPTFSQDRLGSRYLEKILGNKKFSFPKDHTVLMRWLRMVAPNDAIILDFFAGSGTTAEAVIRLNAEDGGTRQCILATSNFEEDGSANGIARDITAERVNRILTGKNWDDGKERETLPGELYYYKVDFDDELSEEQSLGFINLKENFFNKVEQDVSANFTAFEGLDGKLLAVWTNYDRLAEYNREDPVSGEIERINNWISDRSASAIWYVPTDPEDFDDVILREEDFAEGFAVKTVKKYAKAYVSTIRKTVNTLVNTSMIVPFEKVDDDAGSMENATNL